MRKFCLFGFAFLTTLTPALAASPLGVWLIEEKTAQVRVVDCGSALWGVFAWEKVPGVDSNNPDPAMRNNPLIGTALLRAMKANAKGTAWEGKVYNPQDGKQYDATISLADDNTLNLQGCLIYPLCKTVSWTRVPDLPPAAPLPKTAPKKASASAAPKPVDFAKDPDAAVCSAVPGAVPPADGTRLAH